MNTTKSNACGVALLPLVAAILIALPSPAAAAPRFALKIADHDGSVLIAGEAGGRHENWIEVLAFGSGVRAGRDVSGFPVAGASHLEGFVVRKRIDKSSPLLQRAMTTGLLLPAVQAVHLDPSGNPTSNGPEVTLRHVQVVGYRLLGPVGGASNGPLPTEEVTLDYTEIEWTYVRRSDFGQVIDHTSATLARFQATEDPAFDDDNDGVPNDLDADDDNDGIADLDEVEGGSNPFVADAAEDLDGDKHSNGDEVLAGTRMDDSGDYFGIRKITHRREPGSPSPEVRVTIPVKGGRHYRLLATPDPSIPREFWMPVGELTVPEGSTETLGVIQVRSDFTNARSLFFGAEVSLVTPPVPTPN